MTLRKGWSILTENLTLYELNDRIRVLNQVKHKSSRGRRVTEIEREIGRLKKEIKRLVDEKVTNFSSTSVDGEAKS